MKLLVAITLGAIACGKQHAPSPPTTTTPPPAPAIAAAGAPCPSLDPKVAAERKPEDHAASAWQSCDKDDLAACEAECNRGVASTCVKLANSIATHAHDVARELSYYKRACDLGSASGCTNYGATLRQPGAPRVSAECATGFFERGCSGDDAWGCAMLGMAIDTGEGAPRDPALARRALERACFRDDAPEDIGDAGQTFAEKLESGALGPADAATVRRAYAAACKYGAPAACGKARLSSTLP